MNAPAFVRPWKVWDIGYTLSWTNREDGGAISILPRESRPHEIYLMGFLFKRARRVTPAGQVIQIRRTAPQDYGRLCAMAWYRSPRTQMRPEGFDEDTGVYILGCEVAP